MSQKSVQDEPQMVPGPKGSTTLINAVFGSSSEGLLNMVKLQKSFGDVVHLKIGPRNIYLLFHPDDAQHVLQTNNRNYTKGALISSLKNAAGNGLFTSEGSYWMRQRRMMQPFFHRRVIAEFSEIMVAELKQMVEQWETVAEISLNKEMMNVTLAVVAKALFTTALSAEQLDTVHHTVGPILSEIVKRSRRPFTIREKLPLPANQAYDRNLAALNEIIYAIIKKRRNQPETHQDLLQMLMDAEDEDTGEKMNDEQLRDEVITLFVAGHETTATALTWAFKLLSESPSVRRKLQAEVNDVLGGRLPTPADFPNLPYTLAVFEETLRLYPPAIHLPREMKEADTLGGYTLPAGSSVVIHTYALHRHPDFWSNPEGFDPDRFLPEQRKGRHRFAYLPFSSGPRFCIGDSFAKMEAVFALAMICQKFDLNLVAGQSIKMANSGTLRPSPDVKMNIVHTRTLS